MMSSLGAAPRTTPTSSHGFPTSNRQSRQAAMRTFGIVPFAPP
jgi:hypothetical protein